MYGKICILLFISYTCLVTADPVSFIKKCKWDDGKCNKESSQAALKLFAAGIPEYNVGVMDPLNIEYVDASSPNMKLIVTDIVVTGLSNCEVKKVQRFEDSSKIIVKLLCAAELKGKYDMKGQLFVIPIEGNGPLYAKVPKIQITAEVDLNVKSKDGNDHWLVKSWRHTFELKDKSTVKFENLFPDNEFLRTSTNELIAQNGNDVIIEIGSNLIKALVGKVVENIKNFFLAVPIKDLSL
nr:odorant binding protein 5 [Spodoptera frugiperda]